MAAIFVLIALGFVFMIHMAKGGYAGTGGTALVLFLIALIISAALSINLSTVIIITLTVIIALVIVNACINNTESPRQVEQRRREDDRQRTEFFAKSRKWQEDMFTLFGTEQLASGKKFHWQEALEKLDLLEEGYFPYSMFLKYPLSEEELKKYHMFGFAYKTVPIASGEYADLYLKLSDVEKYIIHRNSSGNYYRPSKYEQMPQEIRNLFYDGKVTIGIPFGQDGYVPCQVMTIPEAREFMSRKMEERYQGYNS